MLHEIALGGLLISPLVLFALGAFLLTMTTRIALHKFALRQRIWKDAWFDVSLFVCYLALFIYLIGN